MTIQSINADELMTRLNPVVDALLQRMDSLMQVQIDINQQVRTNGQQIADLRTAIEQAVAECPCDDVATPPVDPPPVPVPAGVQFQGSTWTISAEGKVLRDGLPATTPDYTQSVVKLGIEGEDLVQTNQAGERYAFTGAPDWRRVMTPATPAPTIIASGSIALE